MFAADELIHVVGRGETVYSISRFYRISPEELMKANGIGDPSRLQAGRRLTIPSSAFSDFTVSAAPVSGTVSAPAPFVDYRVVKGDTLYSIARKNGISLQLLLEMNRFSSDYVIKVGDIVKVPGKGDSNANRGASTATAQSGQSRAASSGNASNGRNSSGGSSTGSSSAGSSSAGAVPAAGVLSMRWPVVPKEISYMTGQLGVVVEGEYFEPVKSLTQGKVISAGPWRKFGKVAIVEAAGGYFYMYGGCDSLSVKVGDKISSGTELGKLGVNAVSEKPQLFFMVFRSDTPIDPAKAPRAGGNAKT